VLLHGWTASADLNWFRCYEPLGEQYRVLALDHRGHGKIGSGVNCQGGEVKALMRCSFPLPFASRPKRLVRRRFCGARLGRF
jgi:pimeloyl-ACP methyl ester carboxylesterase